MGGQHPYGNYMIPHQHAGIAAPVQFHSHFVGQQPRMPVTSQLKVIKLRSDTSVEFFFGTVKDSPDLLFEA